MGRWSIEHGFNSKNSRRPRSINSRRTDQQRKPKIPIEYDLSNREYKILRRKETDKTYEYW